ncbi:hypothetical protein [Streptomyces sp. NPDC059008]|uniref:hypothetical protein n=1 Tax=Streptomyces sp. NPDC059008 TaxID=3346693 RepID=UPI00367F7D1F
MDTKTLADAYQQLLLAAERITESTPLAALERSDVDWLLAHIALSDRILATAARDVLAGIPVVIDNQAAMDDDNIAQLIGSTTYVQRIDAVRRNGAEFADLVRQVPERTGSVTVQLRVHDRSGRRISDSRATWAELVDLRATKHIPGHAQRLAELASRA